MPERLSDPPLEFPGCWSVSDHHHDDDDDEDDDDDDDDDDGDRKEIKEQAGTTEDCMKVLNETQSRNHRTDTGE